MDALAGQRVEICRKRGDQSLALAGLHLGDLAGVQHHATDQLHVEMAHIEDAFAGFADDRECFHQQVVDRLAIGNTLPELARLVSKLLLGKGLHLRLERTNFRDARHEPLELALVLRPYDLGEELTDHSLLWTAMRLVGWRAPTLIRLLTEAYPPIVAVPERDRQGIRRLTES
jgi:hypothetical protein